MNKIFVIIALVTCTTAHFACGDKTIDAKSWQSVGKFDPITLSKTLGDHVGQLVGVQFNFRGKDIRHIKPNWYQSSVWQPDPAAKQKFTNVRVVFAKKDLEAFKSITADSRSRARLVLYGRVERDADNHFFFVHVWGGKATIDSAGNAVVTW